MARLETAAQIINDTAIEVGLLPVADPFSSQDESYQQLVGLLNSAGREMVEMYPWEILQQPFEILTKLGDTGVYDLPPDFDHMINQTGWNQTANTPVGGPLSVQMWAFLQGQDLGTTTLYASFILNQNKIQLYPQPPPIDVLLKFYYISRNWVITGTSQFAATPTTADRCTGPADIVMYDPILVVKFLKVKFLAAKGYDIAVAARDFDMTFQARTGMDRGAPILNVAGGRGYPYLNSWRNVPYTGFGF